MTHCIRRGGGGAGFSIHSCTREGEGGAFPTLWYFPNDFPYFLEKYFFDQIGQFIMCHGPLWAKFNAEYGFWQSQGVHTGCSSRLRPHGFPLRW